ncbi:MAG: NADP-dependent isocitrate dehydrogenase [Allosphingosinicella sp.]|uniref:NADP-dependent isocitrate dehydrogenase n=1 Tax=Allosphingosinicella sp. TaxID=2823234 RepID=UPI003932371C
MNLPLTLRERAAASPAFAEPDVPVSVAYGDGIGPEIMAASLDVLAAAGARIAAEPVELGETVRLRGHGSGIAPDTWDSLRRTRVFFKAPLATPQGGGVKSLNVSIRKSLGLYANVRPCVAYAPHVPTRHPGMDLVIVRENEEDLYAGIEHRQTHEVYQCLKLITRPGCERIVRFAFEYARANGRRKVSCFTKDNIMKLTDGLFHQVFREIGAEYPEIEQEHLIVDIGAARLADTPERFDVLVMPNLYGDILSDVAAQIAGSVGLAPSANIGRGGAMFEAVHGCAPDIAGKDVANPSALILAGAMMLDHIGQSAAAARVRAAWSATIADGVHTADIHRDGVSTRLVGTRAFAEAVIERIGRLPEILPAAAPRPTASRTEDHHAASPYGIRIPAASDRPARLPDPHGADAPAGDRGGAAPPSAPVRELVGIDIFLQSRQPVIAIAAAMRQAAGTAFDLTMISNRGVKVWPDGLPETYCTDHWRCRFIGRPGARLTKAALIDLLRRVAAAGGDFVKTEQLYTFDGVPGYSMGQGQ